MRGVTRTPKSEMTRMRGSTLGNAVAKAQAPQPTPVRDGKPVAGNVKLLLKVQGKHLGTLGLHRGRVLRNDQGVPGD